MSLSRLVIRPRTSFLYVDVQDRVCLGMLKLTLREVTSVQEHYLINIHQQVIKVHEILPVCRCLKLQRKVVQLSKIMGVVKGDLKLTSGPKGKLCLMNKPLLSAAHLM